METNQFKNERSKQAINVSPVKLNFRNRKYELKISISARVSIKIYDNEAMELRFCREMF